MHRARPGQLALSLSNIVVLESDGLGDDVAHLTAEIRLDEKGQAPAQITLFAPDEKGRIRTTKGEFIFDAEAMKSVLAKATEYANDYCFDVGHSMVAPPPGTKPADSEEAAGWYKLKAEGPNLVTDGLTWTGDMADRIAARKFRYHSPTFRFDAKTKRITEFVNAALTNLPATKGMRPIVAKRTDDAPAPEPKMNPLLLAALSLSATATEQEVLAALAKLTPFRTEVFTLTGKSDLDEAVKMLKAWKDEAAKVPELTAKIAAMKAKKEAKKLESLVTDAVAGGYCPPSMKDEMLEMGRKSGSEFLKKTLKSLKKLSGVKGDEGGDRELPRKTGAVTTELTKEQLEVCRMLNLDPAVYGKTAQAAGGVQVSAVSVGQGGQGDQGGGPVPPNGATTGVPPPTETQKATQRTSKD